MLANGLTPIYCCGEPLAIRESGTQNDYVKNQLEETIFLLPEAEFLKIVIAYEPIWAIGTEKRPVLPRLRRCMPLLGAPLLLFMVRMWLMPPLFSMEAAASHPTPKNCLPILMWMAV